MKNLENKYLKIGLVVILFAGYFYTGLIAFAFTGGLFLGGMIHEGKLCKSK
jgi:hypothetical protein